MNLSLIDIHLLVILVSSHSFHDKLILYTVGDTQHFACSGTIVELSDGIILIVTVVNLLKHQDADVVAEKLKVGPSLYSFWVMPFCIGEVWVMPFYKN